MSSNRFNEILVIDSIPVGEYNTAKRLMSDLQIYTAAYPSSPPVRHIRIESCEEFIQCLSELRKKAEENDVIPLLHIECHGDEDGFQFADGSIADWEELKLPITELNIATRLNLMLVVAACTGGALAKIMRMGDRSPFWGLIGPTRTVTAGELEKAYSALYLTLLSTESPAEAIQAMDGATQPGQFWRTTAQGLFEKVWANYLIEYCSTETLELRAVRMQETLRNRGTSPLPPLDELKSRLLDLGPIALARYRDVFFMCDLFSENIGRFQSKSLGVQQ